jgi:ATP-dependent helicase/nuclease subunit B
MKEIFSAGLSPSAINKFVACPLDFYYRYIVGLGEEEVVEESMSDATFGSLVHFVLEKFFGNFIDSYPQVDDFMELEKSMDYHLDLALNEVYSASNVLSGENLLLRNLAKKMLSNFVKFEVDALQSDSSACVRKILAVEKSLQRVVPAELTGLGFPVMLKGKADRLDASGEMVHIIDYKTGKVKPDQLKISDNVDTLFLKPESSKALQLMLYTYMYAVEHDVGKISSCIFSMVNHSSGYMHLMKKQQLNNDALFDEFQHELIQLLQRMFHASHFEHNPDSKFCEYCH